MFLEIFIVGGLLLSTYFLLKPDLQFRDKFSTKIQGYLTDSNIRDIDLIQDPINGLRCCGATNSNDYLDQNTKLYKLPKSCCRSNELNQKGECKDGITMWGCFRAYLDEFRVFRDRLKYILYFSLILQINLTII